MDVTKNSTWAVDASRSTAEFSVRILTVTRTSGGFGEVAGEIRFDGEDLAGASVEATIKVPSVRTGNETRDEHIREREGFFEAGAFPRSPSRAPASSPPTRAARCGSSVTSRYATS